MELVERVKRGDEEAFDQLFAYLSRMVYSYIFYLVKRREDIEDLTQEVLLRVFTHIKEQRGNFLPWVYKIARNKTIDFYRRQRAKREEYLSRISEENLPAESGPFFENINPEMLRAAITQLPPEQAEVINLRFIQGASIKEVGEIMKKSVGAVKVLQFRALHRLREYFRNKGYAI